MWNGSAECGVEKRVEKTAKACSRLFRHRLTVVPMILVMLFLRPPPVSKAKQGPAKTACP